MTSKRRRGGIERKNRAVGKHYGKRERWERKWETLKGNAETPVNGIEESTGAGKGN